MPKKNSFLSKINNKINNNPVYQKYQDIFLDITSDFDDNGDLDINQDGVYSLSEKQKDFFKSLYCPTQKLPFRDDLIVQLYPELLKEEIGDNERDLIQFATNYNDTWEKINILPIIAPMGYGKTSLIYYSLIYLHSLSINYQQRVVPLVFNLHHYKNDLVSFKNNEELLKDFVRNKLIKERLRFIFRKTISVSNTEFWKFYKKHCKSSFVDEEESLEDIYINDEISKIKEIKKLRNTEKSNDDFIFHLINYVKRVLNKEIVIVFDNLDPFDKDIIKFFIWEAKKLVSLSEARVLYTIRQTTYNLIYRTNRAVFSDRKLRWNSLPTSEILKMRCDKIDQNIVLEYAKKPLNIEGKIISISNIKNQMKTLISSILSDKGSQLITLFSNGDIRKQMTLLRLIFSSGVIPEWIYGSVLISEKNIDEHYEIKDYLLLVAIIIDHYTTYFGDEAEEVPGVLNIFCSAFDEQALSSFSRLMILSYLYQHRQEEHIQFSTFTRDLKIILEPFQQGIHLRKAFLYSLFRMLNKGLIESPDIHNLDKYDDFENSINEFKLSDLGEFYMTDLIINPNYIIFMKDDVSISQQYFSTFKDASTVKKEIFIMGQRRSVTRTFFANLSNAAYFLAAYSQKEIEFMVDLKHNQVLEEYKEMFGCSYEKLFSLRIVKELENYCKSIKDQPLVSQFCELKEKIIRCAIEREIIS
jgi:hypothetical protein